MNEELRQAVTQAISRAVTRLADHTGVQLPAILVDFTLRGRCAGQARVSRDRLEVRVNREILEHHREEYLAETIPHEVAHLHVLWCHRARRHKPRPHGPEWQALMRDCFQLEPKRCHDYPARPARNVPRKHLYRCACREHRLTSIMHNRIRRVGGAACRSCRTPLSYHGTPSFTQ